MTHYWPIENGQMNDQKGTSHMTQGSSTYFTTDRFGCPYSALALNGGWTHVPSGVYFNTPEFTISVWVYPQNVGLWSRVVDFGNVGKTDNIGFALTSVSSLQPYMEIFSGRKLVISVTSSQALSTNNWQFLTFTYNGINAYIYLNGTFVANTIYKYNMPSLTRKNCYIGKSYDPTNGYSSSYIDDLRFYNKSLSQIEIGELMNVKRTSKCKKSN